MQAKNYLKKKELKKNDLDTILSLCGDLLSTKGAAFGITVARDITDLYSSLTIENKLLFFKKINEKYKPSHTEVSKAIEEYKKTQNDKNLYKLFVTSEGKRREFAKKSMKRNEQYKVVEYTIENIDVYWYQLYI